MKGNRRDFEIRILGDPGHARCSACFPIDRGEMASASRASLHVRSTAHTLRQWHLGGESAGSCCMVQAARRKGEKERKTEVNRRPGWVEIPRTLLCQKAAPSPSLARLLACKVAAASTTTPLRHPLAGHRCTPFHRLGCRCASVRCSTLGAADALEPVSATPVKDLELEISDASES